MSHIMQHWVRQQADAYLRHGGKANRHRQVQLLINALEDIRCHERGVKSAHQVGKAHIHRYFNRHNHLSVRTLYNHYLAFELCWKLLGRVGKPAYPAKLKEAGIAG